MLALAVARRGLFRNSRNLLSHKRRDWVSGDGHEGKGSEAPIETEIG